MALFQTFMPGHGGGRFKTKEILEERGFTVNLVPRYPSITYGIKYFQML